MNKELINNVYNWGKEKGLHQSDPRPQFIKLTEELGELAAAIARDDSSQVIDAVGDMLVVLIQFGGSFTKVWADESDHNRLGEHFLEACLYQAWLEIRDRKGKTVNGTFIKE